jgi:hypothetical protein
MPMLPALFAAAVACQAAPQPALPAHPPAVPASADSTNASLFARGTPFAEFLAKAEKRRELWDRNWGWAAPPDALVARAKATGTSWKFLAVAVDSCSDSVSTIPYLAKLVAMLPGVELRIIGSDIGRAIMDAHKTPDGRGATPTVLLLDASYTERGAFIERPSELQQWMIAQKGVLSDTEANTRKMQWYTDDRGLRTLEEIVVLMERAAARR